MIGLFDKWNQVNITDQAHDQDALARVAPRVRMRQHVQQATGLDRHGHFLKTHAAFALQLQIFSGDQRNGFMAGDPNGHPVAAGLTRSRRPGLGVGRVQSPSRSAASTSLWNSRR